jgi:hypothetical protein
MVSQKLIDGPLSLAEVEALLLTARGHDKLNHPDVRAAVWDKSQGYCWYCGTLTNPWRSFCVEHVLPLARGGSNTLDNLVPCCRMCNEHKFIKTVEEFRQYIEMHWDVAPYVFWFEKQGFAAPSKGGAA